ncbi:MAG: hypothetical protein NTX64_15430, partial [Elusimicrobia bacterium]|nr:hypothetical protein [Elusimicrobiota bacterium]
EIDEDCQMNPRNTFVAMLLLFTGCTFHESAQPEVPSPNSVEHAYPKDAAAFKAALVGDWTSAWHGPGDAYVEMLKFGADGQATVKIVDGGSEHNVTGAYTVTIPEGSFGHITAEITVVPQAGTPVTLRRVNFGLHNAVPQSIGLLLRIDKSPFGALARDHK